MFTGLFESFVFHKKVYFYFVTEKKLLKSFHIPTSRVNRKQKFKIIYVYK